ncbi:hypothetical protein Plhal304r1_c070g0159231 [Plasmopara halstedii]
MHSVLSTVMRFQSIIRAKTSTDDILDADIVLGIILNYDDANYRNEGGSDPEEFFVPYLLKSKSLISAGKLTRSRDLYLATWLQLRDNSHR